MDFSSDDSSCSDFDEDPDTMEVPDIDISIASTMKNHNYLDGDTNNNPYSQIEAENVLDEVEEFSTPPITENNEHEIETEEETQPVIENTKNHTLPQRLPPTTSRNISVCINGRMIKLDTRNAVLVTPELLKSMGGLEGTNVNRSVINNVTRFNGSSARVNNNQPVTDRIPHQVLVNNNPNTTGSSSEQGVLVNSNGAIPRLDFRNGFQIRLPSQRSTGSSAHVNNTQPVTDQISHQVLVSNRITTESSTEQGVLVNTNGAIPRLDYRNGFRIEPPSPRLTGQSIPGGRRILTIDGIIDTVDDDISDPPTLTQQPTQRTISRVQLPQSGRILRRVAIMRPREHSQSTSPNRTVRYSAVNGRQMIPNRRLPPTTTTFGSLAHFRAHAQGQGIRTIRIVRPGESLYSRIKLQSRTQGASLTNGRITNGAQFRNSTVLDIQRTLESQGITDQSVARFVQKHMEQNHLKRKLVTHDHDYNSTKKQKKEIMEEVENEMELGVAETYSTYMPAKLGIGEKHPDPVVETASLSSVAPVDVWYELSIPHRIIANGTLSALQLESITYAAQAHEQILPDKTRAGYLIGDGAGVGKGRTIAGLILENFSKGRRRAVWVSISNDLKFDAERDLQDVGAGYIQVHRLNKMKYSHKISSESNGRNREGVLFCTYSSLIGESNAAEGKYTNRKSQIVQWCGKNFEGLLIFDECHKAKNLCPSGSMKSTKTGQMVLELQASLPNARVLYASATGASEPRNMAYMTRLGLWGKGTTFQTFEDFATAVEEKGVGGMEIVAMDMKLRGMYIARQLSFQDVKFTIVEVQMSKEFIKVYDESVDLWVDAMFKFLKAADLVDGNGNMRKTMNGQYWSTHQRFFKYLCIAAKVEEAIRLAHDAMKNNRCVVIGLQSTGEAGTLDQLEKGDGTLTDFVSTCKGVFQNLVEKHFPSSNQENVNKILSNLSVAQKNIQEEKEMMKRKQRELLQMDSDLELSDDDSDHEPKEQERKMTKAEIEAQKESEVLENIFKKKHGAHVFEEKYEDRKLKKKETEKEKENKPKKPTIEDIEKANEMKRELLSRIEKLGEKLPKNTLDDLIDNLGGAEQVAEMTGRKGRVVQTENGIQYVSRSEQDVPLETLNVKEKERFMDGRKLVAIISEAASSGISLQSDKRALNKRKRYHITLELPWSADKAVQQFGRTHRSNQVSAPEYVFLITNLAGERRFASTVAKRLESLGALTHGDRRAADNRDLSQFNIDNKYGKNALETVMKSILSRESPFIGPPRDYKGDFFQDCTDALIGVGLIIRDPSRGTLTLDKDYSNISKFLNRILGIRVELQNRLFKYFTDTMNAMIAIAKRNGTFDLGILDLGANSRDVIKRVRTITFLYKHPTGVAPIELHKLVVERGLSWKDALQKFEEEASEQHEGFYASRHGNRGRHLVILLIKVERPTGRRGTYETDDKLALYRPNTGKQNQLVTLAEIEHKYYKTDAKEVQNLWEEQYNCTICSHLYMNGDCRSGSNCENGLRRRTYHVLAGAVLPIWLKIEKAIADKSNEEDNEKENKKENRKEKNKMQVIRVKTVDNMKIVGTLIKNHLVDGLVKVLTQEAESVKDEDFPEE